MFDSKVALAIRKVVRLLKMQRIYFLFSKGDREKKFKKRMLSLIQNGDTVWDVGCNVGEYSLAFLNKVGVEGAVVCIDANVDCIDLLSQDPKFRSAKVIHAAISNSTGQAAFNLTEVDYDVTGKISELINEHEELEAGRTLVPMMSLDTLFNRLGRNLCPSLIKIDIEGNELKALSGMSELLSERKLTAICVEVHFNLLSKQNELDALRNVLGNLKALGFKIEWCDPSHFIATRS